MIQVELGGLAPTLALAERALAVELELVEQELAMPAERRPSNVISHWHWHRNPGLACPG